MNSVSDKIQKLLKENKISPAEARRLSQSAGEPRTPVIKKAKMSLFHIIWLGLLFLILAVVYTHVFNGKTRYDVGESVAKIGMLTGKQTKPANPVHFASEENIDVSRPQSVEFKRTFLEKLESHRVEIARYLGSAAGQGPLKMTRFTLVAELGNGGELRNFQAEDSGGRKLKMNPALKKNLMKLNFSDFQIKERLIVRVPVSTGSGTVVF